MSEMTIKTNAPVEAVAFLEDADGGPVTIVNTGVYKCQIRNNKEDASAVLTFQTGGGIGMGTIAVTLDTIEGVLRWIFTFSAPQILVANIPPGSYYGDVLRI